jgi:hypothetical protein
MEWMLKWEAKPQPALLDHHEPVMLVGSCFTEHIGQSLADSKFTTLQNPQGILFDTLSVCRCLEACIEERVYTEKDLFQLHEAWHSWQHHSHFSDPNPQSAINRMNKTREEATAFIRKAGWLIITLGSSFSYKLTPVSEQEKTGFVANCHKAPAQWFNKQLIPIDDQVAALDNVIHRLRMMNPKLKIIFTVSPVRHIRDGVVENNRSKARLLETVHHLVNKFADIYYFPAYELVIDVLRDYRFYDIDLVHPNYAATQFVFEQFIESCVKNESQKIIELVKPLAIARRHRPFNPHSAAHARFMLAHYDKARQLQAQYPWLDFKDELAYFSEVIV